MEIDIKEFSYYEDPEGNLEKLDSVVTSVIDQFAQRSMVGQKKYGTDLDRKDLTTLEWI
jgi:arabinogalactan endo-1,4-beta-galactosidase